MKLITAECLWLECCSCGAVYEDVWSDIQKEIPVCPYCGWSWYQNTEKYKAHGPTKECYRKEPPSEVLEVSSRWQRYQKLIAYLEKLPVDEWIAHNIAWQESRKESINIIYTIRTAFTQTLERVLGMQNWRRGLKYEEVSWPEGINTEVWEEVDVSQDTERQAFALIELETISKIWDSMANSGLTLWEALALQSPEKNTSAKAWRFYNRVKKQLQRFRQRCVKKLEVVDSI